MEYVIIGILVFGVCFLIDKGFKRLFRSQKQHTSGLCVKQNKRYATIGILAVALGIAAVVTGVGDGWVLIVCGSFLVVSGIAFLISYLTFGIYYDEDTFLYQFFGKKSRVFRYGEIQSQKLYVSGRNTVIELYLQDGKTLQLQSGMEGVYPFLDKAFAGWLQQTGRRQEDCDFYDPDNSCWFPGSEE